MYPYIPKKRFGQNFLQDNKIINDIIRAINPCPGESILEIGPGLGALTKPLLLSGANITSLELDRDLYEELKTTLVKEFNNYKIIQGDACSVEWDKLGVGERFKVCGNLPYNISTPLIFHAFNYTNLISSMVFMLQKEVVERIVACPGSKKYGRLTVMIQYFCQAHQLFLVPPESFFPKPKVESAIVKLEPYDYLPIKANNFAMFQKIVAMAFMHRRKTLANSLGSFSKQIDFTALNIDPSIRAENLTIADFVRLSNCQTFKTHTKI